MGPNVKRLVLMRMSVLAIPNGTGNPLGAGVAVLSNPQLAAKHYRQAQAEIVAAVALVKASTHNRWGDDDEAVAAFILREVEKRKQEAR